MNASPLLLLNPHHLPSCLPGGFRKKAKSTPADSDPSPPSWLLRSCKLFSKGMYGQTWKSDTKKSKLKIHPKASTKYCTHSSSWFFHSRPAPDISYHLLLQSATAWTGQNNFTEILFLRFYFKVSHVLSVLSVMSVHRNTQSGSRPAVSETVWKHF